MKTGNILRVKIKSSAQPISSLLLQLLLHNRGTFPGNWHSLYSSGFQIIEEITSKSQKTKSSCLTELEEMPLRSIWDCTIAFTLFYMIDGRTFRTKARTEQVKIQRFEKPRKHTALMTKPISNKRHNGTTLTPN